MVTEFCIQNRAKLVDICSVRNYRFGNSITYCELAELESGYEEPGRSSPIRIVRRVKILDSEAYRDGSLAIRVGTRKIKNNITNKHE
jgi:hypothetical protein